MDVSLNGGTPKSSILIGFSIINHPFWGTTIFGNTHILSHLSLGNDCHKKQTKYFRKRTTIYENHQFPGSIIGLGEGFRVYQEKLDRIFNFWIEDTGHDVYNGCDAYVRVSFQYLENSTKRQLPQDYLR